MIGIYFSGTGNSRYAAELFCREYDKDAIAYTIEDDDVLKAVNSADVIVFSLSCSVQYGSEDHEGFRDKQQGIVEKQENLCDSNYGPFQWGWCRNARKAS